MLKNKSGLVHNWFLNFGSKTRLSSYKLGSYENMADHHKSRTRDTISHFAKKAKCDGATDGATDRHSGL